jgi:hypothetical protein
MFFFLSFLCLVLDDVSFLCFALWSWSGADNSLVMFVLKQLNLSFLLCLYVQFSIMHMVICFTFAQSSVLHGTQIKLHTMLVFLECPVQL